MPQPLTVGRSAEQKLCPEVRVFLTWASGGNVGISRERRLVMMQPNDTVAAVYEVSGAKFVDQGKDQPPPGKKLRSRFCAHY
eukprot:SAG31_NODE_1153_length_9640_cov_2.830206_6_plen_82_part_00